MSHSCSGCFASSDATFTPLLVRTYLTLMFAVIRPFFLVVGVVVGAVAVKELPNFTAAPHTGNVPQPHHRVCRHTELIFVVVFFALYRACRVSTS